MNRKKKLKNALLASVEGLITPQFLKVLNFDSTNSTYDT